MKRLFILANPRIFANVVIVCRIDRSRTSFWKANFENYSRIGPIAGGGRESRELPRTLVPFTSLPNYRPYVPVSDVIALHLVHLMHPVAGLREGGGCLAETAESVHSIFHIASLLTNRYAPLTHHSYSSPEREGRYRTIEKSRSSQNPAIRRSCEIRLHLQSRNRVGKDGYVNGEVHSTYSYIVRKSLQRDPQHILHFQNKLNKY